MWQLTIGVLGRLLKAPTVWGGVTAVPVRGTAGEIFDEAGHKSSEWNSRHLSYFVEFNNNTRNGAFGIKS
jgi:hypothetical protein